MREAAVFQSSNPHYFVLHDVEFDAKIWKVWSENVDAFLQSIYVVLAVVSTVYLFVVCIDFVGAA